MTFLVYVVPGAAGFLMSKPDLTPVTDADQATEEAIRRTLSRVRSRDAVTGEEQGSTGSGQS